MSQSKSFTFAVLGAGGRGHALSDWVKRHPEAGRVVAVAEPNAQRRAAMAQAHQIPAENQFESYEQLLAKPRLADAVFNCLMDHLHKATAIKAMELGYHMMLEKPMAVTLEDCREIDRVRRQTGRIVAVCHSLRHHKTVVQTKQLLMSGVIGQLVTCDLIEGVDPVHQAHSFVRGNWGNQAKSTFMLLAKSCHDLDLISYLVNSPCQKVSSFGNLTYFQPAHAPAGAPLRCTDGCPVERTCPYSALRIYVQPYSGWYAQHAGMTDKTHEQKMEAVRTGPYGRCVYRADNDVVDHQVVSMQFAGPITGTFTMTAFDDLGRRLRLHGTHGAIYADLQNNTIEYKRFDDRVRHQLTLPAQSGTHGGADDNMVDNFVQAMAANDPNLVLTGTDASLASHTIVFAAEQARLGNRVIQLNDL